MKRTSKKALSLFLTLALGLGLVACNTDSGKEKDNSGPSNEKVTEGGESNEEETNAEPLEFSIMSMTWGDHEKSLREDGSNEILDKIQEDSNTKIEFKWFPADQYANRVTTTLATGDIPEVINGAGAMLIDQGAAVALDELLEEHGQNILKSYSENPVDATKLKSTDDGKTYMVPFVLNYQPAYAWSVRADWLENVGITEMPETWEDWLNVWEKFKTEDPNKDGNSTNDIPYSGDIYSLMPIFGMNVSNKFTIMIDENNNWTLAPENENFKAYLEAVRDMYSKGYLDPEFASRGVYVDNNSLSDAINSGVTGSTFTWAEITRTATLGLQEVNPDAKLVGIKPPVGPNGHSGIPGRSTVTPTSVITIGAEKRGIEADIVKFFNYVFSEEGMTTMSYGIEGKHHDIVDGKPVLKEEFSESFANAREAGINYTPLAHNFFPEAYESIMLAGKTYEESEPAVKQFYDALYAGEGHWFNSAPILNTEAYVNKGAELFGQLGTALAECVIGEISIDEFYSQYENLKASGLQEIIDQGNEAWTALNS